MKFKTKTFAIISLVSACVLALTIALSKNNTSLFTRGITSDFEMELNASNSRSNLSVGSYSREGAATGVFTKGDYSLNLKYRLAQKENNQHVMLAPHGFIYNEVDSTTHKNKITSLSSIRVTYTSDSNITIRTSIRNDGKEFSAPRTITSNTSLSFDDEPYYFIIEAGDSAAHISNIVLSYSCHENSLHLSSLNGNYTGKGSDNYIYKLSLNGTSMTLSSLNKQSNFSYNGTAEIVNNSQLKGTFTINNNGGHYITSVSEDHRVLTYSSKDGSLSSLPTITFYKVYQVEDFERFTTQGDGFGGSGRGADSLYSTSGLRSQWHADWSTSSTSYAVSYFGNSDWKVMGSTDFLTYTSNKGHNSSKAAVFKGNTNGLRYIQMKAPLGLPNIIGRGSYLSFWAKVYSNSSLSTVKTTDTSVKVYGFYNQTVTSENIGTRTAADVTIPANSDWARYTIELDSTKDYYSFGFYDNKGSTMYMVVDDVEIYTADPYAEYVIPYPEGTYQTKVGSYHIVVALGNMNNGLVSVKISTADVYATGINYNTNNFTFTINIPSSSKVGGYTVGNITGTYDYANDQLINVNCSGQLSAAVSNATLTHPTVAYYNCDGSTSTLQTKFLRRYRSSGATSWSNDTSNADRLVSNTTNNASGQSSLTVRPCGNTFDAYGFASQQDLSSPITVTDIHFWVYNPCDYDITFEIYVYKGANFGSAESIGLGAADKAKAKSWNYVSRGFSSRNYYNFIISVWTKDQTETSTTMSAKLVFDDIYFS